MSSIETTRKAGFTMTESMPASSASSAPLRRTRGRARATAAPIGCEWCVGTVDAIDTDATGTPTVTSGGLRLRAARAASCLLEPAAGDSVACLRIAPDEVWILAVLQREEGVPNLLRCAGDTRFVVSGGALEIDAPQLRLQSDQLDIATQKAAVAVDSAELVGRQFHLIATTVKVVGSLMSSVMDRVQHFSRHYLRTTDGIDRVAATHLECEAKQLARIEGEHVLVNGRELVKARGAQIHFG